MLSDLEWLLAAANISQGHSKVQTFTMGKMIKKFGVEAANEFAAFVSAQKYLMKDAVDREELTCEFEMRRSYDVFVDGEEAQAAEELYRTAVKEGHDWARDLDFVGASFVEQVCHLTDVLRSTSWPKYLHTGRLHLFEVQKLRSVCLHALSGPTNS